jgi:hypothetical protein
VIFISQDSFWYAYEGEDFTMSASQSNLSDPHYGSDLVVAVTQASINATLKQLLIGLTAPEVTICYVYDEHDNLVPIDYQTLLVNAQGSDPFKVPNAANPATNKDLVNLANANFAGGVRAMIGLPDVPLANLPPIATLGAVTGAPVLFNLLCAEFQITGFQYGSRGTATWINASQPSEGTPWHFSANVYLNSTTIDPNSPVPPAVQQRISDLQHQVQNAFTIQKLFLDLDTAVQQSVPTIVGIPQGWPVWNLITTVFLGSYLTQLRQTGDPVLSYSFTLNAPRPTTLELGSVSRQCCHLLDGNGQAINNPTPAQQNAATLVYVGTQSTHPPVPVPFAWNWMELNDVTAFSGVQSVRRDVFLNYFNQLINPSVSPLCLATKVRLTHSGETFTVDFTSNPSDSPQVFRPITPIGAPGTDGFTDVLSVTFVNNSHDDSESSLREAEIKADYNYTLNGRVAVNGNQIRIKVQAKVFMSFSHREVIAWYTDLTGANYYDKTLTVLYTLGVDQNGALQVTQSSSIANNSAAWHFSAKGVLGIFGLEDDVKDGVTSVEQNISSYIDSAFTDYVGSMTDTINGYRAWVFVGNDAFTFKKVSFSQGLDLIAQLTYVNPDS